MDENRPNEVEQLREHAARLETELEQEVRALDELTRICTQLNSTLKLSELLTGIMNSAKELLRADACSVALLDEDTGELVFEVAVGEGSEEIHQQRVPSGQGIAGHVVETGELLLVNTAKDSPYFYGQIDEVTGSDTRNVLAVPLRVKERTIGVVEVINARGREGFDERDQRLAQALTSQAAVAIDNAGLYQKLADALVTSRMSYRL